MENLATVQQTTAAVAEPARTESDSASKERALPAILYVDDDWNILEAFQRQFRKKYAVQTSVGPTMGLQALEKQSPFDVVISDLQMPVMNGIQFLSAVRAQSPDTVRVMLSGQGDLATAVAAVNQGNIFRFLVKPCASAVLEKVIEAGIEQRRLIKAEKQLAQETLLGCLNMMVDVLSVVQPHACGRANRVRGHVLELAAALKTSGLWPGMQNCWEFEAAALLSQVGWISVPPELVEKAARAELATAESQRLTALSGAAARMLERIPRLEVVARIISGQSSPFSAVPETDLSSAAVGAQILRVAVDFDDLRQRGVGHEEALTKMRARPGLYNPQVFAALAAMHQSEAGDGVLDVRFHELAPHMIVEEDIVGTHGLCVIGKGQEITEATVARLSGFSSVIPPDRICKVRIRAA